MQAVILRNEKAKPVKKYLHLFSIKQRTAVSKNITLGVPGNIFPYQFILPG
jgi:hypothetical protein